MKIKFKDGKEIEFRKFGNIWFADSVILENTKLNGSLDELRFLKVKINKWFEENAPREIRGKYKVSLPLWEEIRPLTFKDQLAYREGKTTQAANYFLGDEDRLHPILCGVGVSTDDCGWFCCVDGYAWSRPGAFRLCLEESK